MQKTIAAFVGLAVVALAVLFVAVACTATDGDTGYHPFGYYPVAPPHPGATGYRTDAPRTHNTPPKTNTRKGPGTPPQPAYRPAGGRRR